MLPKTNIKDLKKKFMDIIEHEILRTLDLLFLSKYDFKYTKTRILKKEIIVTSDPNLRKF